MSYFNSIKVRLKLIVLVFYLLSVIFQFHKGTIKTFSLRTQKSTIVYFNSIKVRLKRIIRTHFGSGRRYFNSIKVRLKRMMLLLLFAYMLFQFHKGTIKTVTRLILHDFLMNFNSIKVRLKRFLLRLEETQSTYFNSIKVRLKPFVPPCVLCVLLYFNSIKVRLKQNNGWWSIESWDISIPSLVSTKND